MSKPDLVRGYSRLTLTNDAGAPALACAHVLQVASRLGFSEAECAAIELGVEEATSNVVRHAFPTQELHTFEVVCLPTALGIEICIRDQGQPFDPRLLPEFDPAASVDGSPVQGLGTRLMKQVFDAVVFRNLGREGKETSLVKYRSHTPIGDYAPVTPTPDTTAPEAADTVTTIRRMAPDEAIEVARCVYESYGYSYPYEHIYYPERLQALNASGDLCSVVAVTASGRIAGHTALVFDNNGSAELAIAVTRPEYRGQGVARRIGDFLLDEARAAGLATLTTKAVTAHTFTQQFCHALGFKDCALLPGHAPASIQFRNIAEQLQQRESCILALRRLLPVATRPALYLPVNHRDMIQQLYGNLDDAPQWHEPEVQTALPEQAILSVTLGSGLDLALIEVQSWGQDIVAALQRQLVHLRREHLAVVELLIPLSHPAGIAALAEVEQLGFFFTGVLPEPNGHDQLVMHYLIDPAIDYNRIQAHAPIAQDLLAYVQQRDPNRAT